MVTSKSGGSEQEVVVMASWKLTARALFMLVAKTTRPPRPPPLMNKGASGTIMNGVASYPQISPMHDRRTALGRARDPNVAGKFG